MGKKGQNCHWDEILFKMSTILPMLRFWLFLTIFGSFLAFLRNMRLEGLKKIFYVKIGYILYIKKISEQNSHIGRKFTCYMKFHHAITLQGMRYVD